MSGRAATSRPMAKIRATDAKIVPANVDQDAPVQAKKKTRSLSDATAPSKAATNKRGAQRSNKDATDSGAAPPKRAKTGSRYDMRLPKQNLPDKQIHEEVESRLDETPQEAFAQAQMEEADAARNGLPLPDWDVDYIVGLTKDENIIVKWTDYATPTVVKVPRNYIPDKRNPKALRYCEYWEGRKGLYTRLAQRIIQEIGLVNFNQKYPHQFAPDEDGHSIYHYATDKITLKQNRLRAFEEKLRYETNEVNLPPIHCLDWTGKLGVQLPLFKFTHRLIPSKKVLHALATSDEYGALKCSKGKKKDAKEDTCQGSSCQSALVGYPRQKQSNCGCKIVLANGKTDKSPLECIGACGCDPATCRNRVIQTGRQITVLIWMDDEKNYTLRTLESIKKGEFVAEYVGEVITAYEAALRDNQTYFMDMACVRVVERDDGNHSSRKTYKKLVIDAAVWGNESRFISHSCHPNLRVVTSYVERAGGFYSRMVFVAARDIEFGEELTFDYFPTLKAGKENINHLFAKCLCGAKFCHFKKTLSEKNQKAQDEFLDGTYARNERDKALAEGDDYSDGEEEKKMNVQEKHQAQVAERAARAAKKNGEEEKKKAAAQAVEESEKEEDGEEEDEVVEVEGSEDA